MDDMRAKLVAKRDDPVFEKLCPAAKAKAKGKAKGKAKAKAKATKAKNRIQRLRRVALGASICLMAGERELVPTSVAVPQSLVSVPQSFQY